MASARLNRTCLVLGDIGDNGSSRPSISFILMPEKQTFADTETPLRIIQAQYPDGPHNAEGFAMHPSGDLYLVTKTGSGSAQVFRLTRDQLRASDGAMQTFSEVGTIDLAPLLGDLAAQPGAMLVTGFDIAPDGKRAVDPHLSRRRRDRLRSRRAPAAAKRMEGR